LLPQLKWRTLNDADMKQFPFEAEKRFPNVIIEVLGGWEVAMLPIFLGSLGTEHIFSETKKYTLYALGRSNSSYFSIFG